MVVASQAMIIRSALHAIVWIFLYLLPFLLTVTPGSGWTMIKEEVFNNGNAWPFLLVISFFYTNYYFLLPRWYLRKRFVKYFSSVVLVPVVIIILQYFAGDAGLFNTGLAYMLALFIVSTLLSVVVCQQSGIAKTEAEIEKIKTRLQHAQMNPHFLFNSLNRIYGLAIEQSKETPAAIIQLSGFMRYLLKEANNDSVALVKEIDYIRNYLALQQGKLVNTVSVNFSIADYYGALQVAPLLAMPFIENAFKHGVNPAEDSVIHVDLSISGNKLQLQMINNKVTPAIKAAGQGLGIKNARQRLQKLYPCRHHLEILDNEKIYSMKLSVKLQ